MNVATASFAEILAKLREDNPLHEVQPLGESSIWIRGNATAWYCVLVSVRTGGFSYADFGRVLCLEDEAFKRLAQAAAARVQLTGVKQKARPFQGGLSCNTTHQARSVDRRHRGVAAGEDRNHGRIVGAAEGERERAGR